MANSSAARFTLALLLIALAAVFLYAHNRSETFPPKVPLQLFPEQIGTWQASDKELPEGELNILGYPEYILRSYNNHDKTEKINLFIAYYKTQRTGETPHSPQNCLPGSGFTPIEKTRVTLTMPGHEPFPVNRYIVVKGEDRSIVLYWFWTHNRGVASEYWNKYYLVRDSIRLHRSDGSMIRFDSPMLPGETSVAAQERIALFVRSVLPMLNVYIPR